MRAARYFPYLVALAAFAPAAARAQSTDDDLRLYAVNVVKTAPLEKQFTGYGIYLGQGTVITAAHVVGHWPMLTHPRVLVAGQDLPAKIVKEGSFESTDLALLAVDEGALPVSLRLRRNPLCKARLPYGAEVVNVVPEGTSRAHVISPLSIPPQLRKFDTLIDGPRQSGSGLFDPEKKCLAGIVSGKMQKYRPVNENGRIRTIVDGFAGYFVAVDRIAGFMPSFVHF